MIKKEALFCLAILIFAWPLTSSAFEAAIDTSIGSVTTLEEVPADVGGGTPIIYPDTPPTVVSFTPADSSTDVSVSVAPVLVFSEPLDTTSVTHTSVQLRQYGGDSYADSTSYITVPIEFSFADDNQTLTLTPVTFLEYGQYYYIFISSTVTDVAENHFAEGWLHADREWHDFQTELGTPQTTSYTLTYVAGANGTIEGDLDQEVEAGNPGTAVTAVPNPGYRFVNWSDGSIENPRVDENVTENLTFTANFEAIPAELPPASGGGGGSSGGSRVRHNPLSSSSNLPTTPTVLGAQAFRFTSNLSLGSSSDEIKELQNRLQKEGVFSGPITGTFGPITLAAVKAFQAARGVPNTGFVGPLTRLALNGMVIDSDRPAIISHVQNQLMMVTSNLRLLKNDSLVR